MKIIFRADDLGFSEGVNCGIYRSIASGAITCTGLMPNMPQAAAGYEMVKDTGVEIGQHTNICVGRPITDPALIPSLVQPNGEFCTSKEIRARKEDTIVLEEVELEIQAQLDRFRQVTGRDPAYFEGHAVMSPNFFQGLQNVAARNGLLYCETERKRLFGFGVPSRLSGPVPTGPLLLHPDPPHGGGVPVQ